MADIHDLNQYKKAISMLHEIEAMEKLLMSMSPAVNTYIAYPPMLRLSVELNAASHVVKTYKEQCKRFLEGKGKL